MPALGVGQKPIVMPSYPHMLAEDTEVWSAYLKDPVVPIIEVWYDVHVGRAMQSEARPGTVEARVAAGVSRKRIDCVCRVGGGYWVVEVKPYGSMLALGQVVTYTRLFVQDYRPDGEVIPVVVCKSVDPDMIDDFDAAGVLLIGVE